MKILGVVHSGYNTSRNISSLPFKGYKVEKEYDFFKFPEHLIFKITGKTNSLLLNLHQDFSLTRCDIFHFFNTISFSKTPWVTTFETSVPRLGGGSSFYTKMGVKLLAGRHCKKLIAMSACAKNIQLDFLWNNYPDYYDAIEKKLTVIYPSQKLLLPDYSQKKKNATLSFAMIGSEFLLKGGLEVLLGFDKLLSEGNKIHLYIVSKLEISWFGTENDRKTAMEIINKYPDNIFHYPSLPNAEVLTLFLKCHVAMLPTYADTFGYSVLEAQASGCPVITTNIRALPEINNDTLGWVIPVPKNELGQGIINSSEEKKVFSNILLQGLEKVLLDIIANPEQIAKKGAACIERIRENYNPAKNAQQLEEIYDKALAEDK